MEFIYIGLINSNDNQNDKERIKRPPRKSPYNWNPNLISQFTYVPQMPSPFQIIEKPDFEKQKEIHNQITSQINELKKQQWAAKLAKHKQFVRVESELKQKINSGFQQLQSLNQELKLSTQTNKQSNDEIIIVERQLEHFKQQEDQILGEIDNVMKTIQSSSRNTPNNKEQEKIEKIQEEIKYLESKLTPFKMQTNKSMEVRVMKQDGEFQLSDFNHANIGDEGYAQVQDILKEIEDLKKKLAKAIKHLKYKPKKGNAQEIQKPIYQKKRMSIKEIKERIKSIKSQVQSDKQIPEKSKEVNSEISKLENLLKLEVKLHGMRQQQKQAEVNLKYIRKTSHKSYQQMKSIRAAIKETRDKLEHNKNIRDEQKFQNQINEYEDDSDDRFQQQIQNLKLKRDESNQQFDQYLAEYQDQKDLIKYIKFVKHRQYLLKKEDKRLWSFF